MRIIIFKFEDWEIHLGLPSESWTIDSDVKADLIEKASEAFSRRLKQLESPIVVEMKKRVDSATSGTSALRAE